MLKKIKVDFLYDISNILECEQLIDCSVAFSGGILVLTLLSNSDRYEEKGFGVFPKVRSEKKNHYRVHHISIKGDSYIDINGQDMNYHFIRDLGNETFLIACSRSYFYNESKYDLNAHIFDNKGNKLREFLIGDGVQDIKIAADGIIWTSYFDEGVFGNCGWDNPVGSEGLRAWDMSGNPVYSYKPLSDEYFIADCYALNISEKNDIWFYFYTGFYIAVISKEKNTQYWESPIKGSQILLVKDNYLLLDGGYENRNEYLLLRLEENNVRKIDTLKFFNKEGEKIEELSYFYGSKALFLKNNRLYMIDIEKLIE